MSYLLFHPANEWTLTRAGDTHRVNFIQTDRQFTGYYVGTDDKNFFSGEIVTSKYVTLVHFVQTTSPLAFQGGTGYQAIHVGKLDMDGCIEGHWYDTSGNQGQFHMSHPGSLSPAIARARDRAIAAREANDSHHPRQPQPKSSGNNATHLIEKAHHYVRRKNTEKAITQLDSALAETTEDSRIYNLLGHLCRHEGLPNMAFVFIKAAIALNPEDKAAQEHQAQLLAQFPQIDDTQIDSQFKQEVGNGLLVILKTKQVCLAMTRCLINQHLTSDAQVMARLTLTFYPQDPIAKANYHKLFGILPAVQPPTPPELPMGTALADPTYRPYLAPNPNPTNGTQPTEKHSWLNNLSKRLRRG